MVCEQHDGAVRGIWPAWCQNVCLTEVKYFVAGEDAHSGKCKSTAPPSCSQLWVPVIVVLPEWLKGSFVLGGPDRLISYEGHPALPF